MKLLNLLLIGLVLLQCTGTVKNSRSITESDLNKQKSPVISEKSNSPPVPRTAATDEYSAPVPPLQWIGKKVTVLPKQQLVCAQGYTLTTCRARECDTASVDTEWEHASHRVKCEKISGDSLFVESVEPDKDEWIITFTHIPTEKRLYARTHKHAVAEIAYSDDLAAARRRWLNTVIFSKKGVISVNESATGTAIKSLRIKIQDSLLVVDVRWGMTPLPVKPLWLIVTTRDHKQGFIPVRFSWTNTMTDRITDRLPWEDDLFEANPALMHDWDDNQWELINNHRVVIGMTPDQVTTSWGYPSAVDTISTEPSYREIWLYPSQKLSFVDNKLTDISERPSPGK